MPPTPHNSAPDPKGSADASTSPALSWPRVAKTTAYVSAVFCLLIPLLLAVNHFHSLAHDSLNSPALTELKLALARTPRDEALKKQIRALDQELREIQAWHVAMGTRGAWLFLGSALLFLSTFKYATQLKRLPRPDKSQKSADDEVRETAQVQWVVLGAMAVVGGAAWMLAANGETQLKASAPNPSGGTPVPVAEAAPVAPTTPFPTPEEIKSNWPRFRGPDGLGLSAYTNLPAAWNTNTGEGILWKVEVPISGPNSPILWGNRLFLTGANSKKREIYCYDALSGKLLWQKAVVSGAAPNAEAPNVVEDSGTFAPSTAATDGRRIYAIFATGDVAAFDFAGNQVWSRYLGPLDNSYGHASSLVQHQNRLLVQLDQGTGKDGKSKLLALDALTGQTAWESPARPVPNSWSTPIVIHAANKDQIITCGNPWVIAYDAANGSELWRAKVLYGEVTPSPVFANGLVYTVMDGEKLSAIKPDGSGDVTKTHVAWSAEDGLPDITSPVGDGQRIFLITTSGLLTCYNAPDGKKVWEKELELGFHSSPSIAGERLYLWGDKGMGLVLAAAGEFKELARSDLGEPILSSPAFADGRIYIRGKKNLFCLGNKGK